MPQTIDMQLMRYINLFGRVTRISTTNCFVYNNTIYFAVPKAFMTQAIGKGAENVRRVSETFRKKVKIVVMPNDSEIENDKITALKKFVTEVVSPVEFTSFEMKENIVTLSGSRESKAILIGRDRNREKELAEVLEKLFGVKEFKIM